MRPGILLSLTLMAACSEGPGPTGPDHPVPAPTYLITGEIRDSVLGLVLAGIQVHIGDSGAVSDSTGSFRIRSPSGPTTVSIDDYRFARVDFTQNISRDQSMFLQLRGHAPYVVACAFSHDSVSATVIDFEGRKTVNRRSQSTMTARGPGGTTTVNAEGFRWRPVDYLTWTVSVPVGPVGASQAEWSIEDIDGNVRLIDCTSQTMTP